MTPPSYHPQPDTLMSYVAGTLPNAISCVVACHLSFCSDCVKQTRWLGMVGGILLKNLHVSDKAFIDRAAMQWTVDRLLASRPERDQAVSIQDPLLPKPLVRYLGFGGRQIPWKPVI